MSRSIVLVPGAQHGAWAFRRIMAPLRAHGLDPHPMTLTGLGDRAHLLDASVDLETHVEDVVATIAMEGLADGELTLVGHSYGGMVAAAVVARLNVTAPGSVDRLVYFDAPVPIDGDTCLSVHPHGADFARRRVLLDGVEVMPRSTGAALGLSAADLEWVRPRLTPQPYRCLTTPLRLPNGWDAAVERVYLRCTESFPGEARPYLSRVRTDDGWRMAKVVAGHDAMISAPDAVAGLLGDLCSPRMVTP